MIELINIKPSTRKDKKFMATFKKDNKTITSHFGAKGYEDYTDHKDKKRKDSYINRHKKDLETNDPTRPGYLSMFILWNKPSLEDSIKDYQKRLKTNNWSLP